MKQATIDDLLNELQKLDAQLAKDEDIVDDLEGALNLAREVARDRGTQRRRVRGLLRSENALPKETK